MADLPGLVLDSFALLAYLTDEPTAARIETLLEEARKEKCRLLLPLINLGEILYITERRGGITKAQDTLALLRQLPIEVLPVDEQSVLSAAHIKANYTLSYADAFVVAASQQEGAMLLTGDREFRTVEELVSIEWLDE